MKKYLLLLCMVLVSAPVTGARAEETHNPWAESAKAMVGCPLSAAGDGVLALFGAVGSVIIQPTEGLAAIIDDDYKTEQFTRGYASVLYDMGSDLTHAACFKHLERLSAGADQAERSESTGELVADPLSGLVLGQGAQ